MTTTDRIALALLSLILATLLALYLANSADSSPRRPTQRQIDRLAEQEYGLPRGLLARHRRYERAQGWKCLERPWNDNRGQVCGPHQVLIWDRTSRDGKRLGRVVRGRLGAAAAGAMIMTRSRAWCAARVGKCKCPWELLNRGDRDRLCARLAEPTSKGDES